MMNYRSFWNTGWQVSEIRFGSWAIGKEWGYVSQEDALEGLWTASGGGVNFIDSADVYGDGRSERVVGKVIKEFSERIYAATKAGRCLQPHVPEGFTIAQFALWWRLMFDVMSLAIPGAKNLKQAQDNKAASDIPALDIDTIATTKVIYNKYIRPRVNQRW